MRVVIVGDLHMSSGDRRECFRADDAFAHFLEHVREADGLVILGDLIDFLNVGRADTSAASALAKLERVAAAHATTFRALASLPCPISIVLGNHDVELAHPAVRERFRELASEARIDFHPWIYYVPGLLYAEHGSQYHDLNAFPAVVAPVARDSIELPLGSHQARYLLDRAESRLLVARARFLRALVAHAARAWRPRRRAAYREQILRPYADEAGLSFETLAAIDELAALSPLAFERRALRTLATRAFPHGRPPRGAPAELRRAASAIHALLEAEGASVPVYAFGHTHAAEQLTLTDDERHYYVNCGTWSSLLPRHFEPLGDAARFTFVEVTAEATPRLLRWNDAQRRAEPYRDISA